MKKINDLVELALRDFDYLFQEGVVFKQEEIEKLKKNLKQFDNILKDKFIIIEKGKHNVKS